MSGTGSVRRLYVPRRAVVRVGRGGAPLAVNGQAVEAVRESWLVEDRWWTGRPVRRRYWEVVAHGGRNLVVFSDLEDGGWFSHRS